MLRLIGLVVSIGLADSMNPSTIAPGLYLALATFGFGVLLQRLIYPTALMFGAKTSLTATRLALGGLNLTGDKAFYFVCVAVVALGHKRTPAGQGFRRERLS